MTVASWFHEYGFVGGEDFEEAERAVEQLGFSWVYGGGNADPDWPGWPAHADDLQQRLMLVRAWVASEEEAGLHVPLPIRVALRATSSTTPEPDRVEAT